MKYREIGRSGVRVSEIGFGGAGAGLRNYLRRWDPSREEKSKLVEQAVRRAVELGITVVQFQYNLMYQHVSDWHSDTGVIRQAEEQGMGVILMRPLTSRVFQRLVANAFPRSMCWMWGGCCSMMCSRIPM